MLQRLSNGDLTISLPKNFDSKSMHSFINQALNDEGDARAANVHLDFGDLRFIDPTGVVVLSNLIEYLRRCGVVGTLRNLHVGQGGSPAVVYLDDAGFFKRYNGKPLREHSATREGMLPLQLIDGIAATGWVFNSMVPWLAAQLGVSDTSLGTIRVCLEEIFNNIDDHSGTRVGCVTAQIFHRDTPNPELHIAISDFGSGIPALVRQEVPELDDAAALRLACEEGFTTKSNVRNRGAGLPNLIKIITLPNWGYVQLDSGRANLSAVGGAGAPKIVSRMRKVYYPGTLVRIKINVNDVVDSLPEADQNEDLQW